MRTRITIGIVHRGGRWGGIGDGMGWDGGEMLGVGVMSVDDGDDDGDDGRFTCACDGWIAR